MSAHFCGVNTPTIANFKLLTMSLTQNWEDMCLIGSWEFLGAELDFTHMHATLRDPEIQVVTWASEVFRNALGDSNVKQSLGLTSGEFYLVKCIC